ncbi:hypothetical protein DOTSEDRAFT_89002 [Dothistroma septosporum NZE10]|uniref:Uncharacterized protein n=1 Tax=Dothistroma septosporum (strain NZE10 / CBS 128990) TaxID=675120 RepID=M2WLV3_DOTSN|nr:hypothetical protein DOTSEDRAFT_89002 [Dothistroma septosporum NZE10]
MAMTDLLKTSNVLASLLVLLLSYTIIGAIVNYAKLRQFKGPRAAAFSRAWLFWEECSARLPESQRRALRQYGSPARIGPDLLVTDDPELIRHMSAPGSRWTRSHWYDAMKMDPRIDTVFSTRDEQLHTELKAKEAGGYNGRDIASLEPDIDARVGDMLYLVRNTYNGLPMDMANIARFFTLDVLSTVAFGSPFGFMAANDDLWGYNKLNASFMVVLGLQANHSSVYNFFTQPWLQALAAPKVTDKSGIGPALAFARKAVAERYGPDGKVKNDMLGHFVDKGLSQVQCEAEAFLQIIAGSDSTTGVMRNVIWMLAGSPPTYARLRAEVDAAVEAGVTRPVVKYAETSKLPYLRAVVQETIRIFPPLFGLKSKVTLSGDIFKGIYYPPGTEVCDCNEAVMRNKDVFGEDAEYFRPERLLEGDEVSRRTRQQTIDTSFGAGRFQCLGKHIAMMELHKATFEMIRAFDFQIADPTKGIESIAHNVHIASGLNMIARPRI